MLTSPIKNNASALDYKETGAPATGMALAGNDAASPARQNAELLRQLALQMESFLTEQIERLKSELARDVPSTDRDAMEREMAELQEAREAWEEDRQQECRRMQEDSQRLIDAWEKLEAEQREMLKHRVAMRGAPSGPPITGKSPPTSAPRSESPSAISQPPTLSAAPAAGAVAHKNQLQFQQLRREMLEHARQRRKR